MTFASQCVCFFILGGCFVNGAGNAHPHRHHSQRCSYTEQAFATLERSYLAEPLTKMSEYLQAMVEVQPRGVWLQVGSNTMDPNPEAESASFGDPLAKFLPVFTDYEKIFIEPIPDNFKHLLNNVKAIPNSVALQYAILEKPGPEVNVSMWCYPEEDWTSWRKGACSLSKDKMDAEMKSYGMERPNSIPINVTGISLDNMLQRHVPDLSELQIVIIDVEGFDAKVVRQLPFGIAGFRPKLIVWENKWLAADEPQDLVAMLHEHCYTVADDFENTFAIPLLDQ